MRRLLAGFGLARVTKRWDILCYMYGVVASTATRNSHYSHKSPGVTHTMGAWAVTVIHVCCICISSVASHVTITSSRQYFQGHQDIITEENAEQVVCPRCSLIQHIYRYKCFFQSLSPLIAFGASSGRCSCGDLNWALVATTQARPNSYLRRWK